MKRILLAAIAFAGALPVAVVAHHSFSAEYDGSKPMELVGVINKVDQQNPHGFFYLNVTGANGRVTNWALETPGPNQLIRTGFTERYKEMIDNKEVVTVKAFPARDGAKRAFAETITFDPQPGLIVTRAPRDIIEELPPDQRPEGVNVTWIPG